MSYLYGLTIHDRTAAETCFQSLEVAAELQRQGQKRAMIEAAQRGVGLYAVQRFSTVRLVR